MAIVSDDATTGSVVELNCETDFVGMNEKFKAYAEKIAKAALAAKDVQKSVSNETVLVVVTYFDAAGVELASQSFSSAD